ncbi:MAG: hypothetical protein ABIY47_19690 [Opitutaceae bacterium]
MAVVPAWGQPYSIQWRAEPAPVAVEVDGLTAEQLGAFGRSGVSAAEWQRVFPVFAQQGNDASMPPMAGSWTTVGNRLRFEPRFPLTRGVRYRAEFRSTGGAPLISFFELPADMTAATTHVAQIFPSGDRLPENQLKFYVQFSAPMSRGGTYQHIHLRNAAGAEIDLPFLELEEELWDLTMTRLTLLIDPGRIKRGVKPLEDDGAVFEAGKNYSLAIDAGCRDAAGRPLLSGFEKKIQVIAADRIPPDPARWKISSPLAGTREALVVDFDEPMDHALALRLIAAVRKEGGKNTGIAGDAALSRQEQRWSFVPTHAWPGGAYQLIVQTNIEDLAGNNIGKAFDVDVRGEEQRQLSGNTVSLDFSVR